MIRFSSFIVALIFSLGFTSAQCELNDVEIQISSPLAGQGGPNAAEWWVTDESEQTVAAGYFNFINNPWYLSEELCLANGCYTIHACADENANPENFFGAAFFFGEPMEFISGPEYDGNCFEFTIAVNSDCGPMPDCPQEMWAQAQDGDPCGVWLFEIGSFVEGEQVIWNFGDGSVEEGGHFTQHFYEEPGEYEVCGFYTSPICPEGVEICQWIYVEPCGECTEIWMQFETNLDLNGPQNVPWQLVGGDYAINGSCAFQPGYQECNVFDCIPNGCYTLSVFPYPDPLWDENFQVYVEIGGQEIELDGPSTLWNDGYEFTFSYNAECEFGCDLGMEIFNETCDLFVSEAYGYPENATINWYINDDYVGQGHVWTWQLEPGEYEICAAYETPDCPFGAIACEVINVAGNEACPTDLFYAPGQQCGYYIFEVFEFVEGEEVMWDFGDGTSVNGGHYIEHFYEEPGEYTVCAWYYSPLCECGVDVCVDLYYEPCGDECTDVAFGIDIPEQEGNAVVSWAVFGNDYFLEGICEYPPGQQFCDFEACLPDGCYNISIWPDAQNADEIDIFINANGENIIPELVYIGDVVMTYEFGINAECGGDCPEEIAIQETLLCGGYVCWIPNDDLNPVIQWFLNGEYQSSDQELILDLDPGVYTICASYFSENCQGAEICAVLEVPNCGGCPEEIVVSEGWECGTYEFWIPNEDEFQEVLWYTDNEEFWDDDSVELEFSEPGVYIVCAVYYSEFCQGQEICVTIEVEDCNTYCPDEIWADANDQEGYCDMWFFEIGEFVDGEEVIWYYGDGSVEEGGHFTSHSYEETGEYLVCAYYTSPLCPEGVEVCTWIYVDLDCLDACPNDIWADNQEGDCNMWLFEIGSFQEGEEVVWSFGDGTEEVGGHFIQHEYEESGEYYVCGYFTSNDCPDGVQLCIWIYVDVNCDEECPEEMWAEAQDGEPCGIWLFEIGSFVEGEQVVWNFGDGTEEIGGHFTQHFYEEPGEYLVCGFYTSPSCPNGTTICTWIYVTPCEEDCSEVGLAFDSFINEGGPEFTHWAILQNGQVIEDGVCQYSIGQPYCDAVVCLPDGCYDVWMWGDFGDSYEGFFSGAFLNGDQLPIVSGPESCGEECFTYTFSLNGECDEEPECDLDVVYDQIEGNAYLFFAEPSDPDASIWWDFGDGVYVEGAIQDYEFPGPGTYEVCAFYETPDCPYGVEECVIIVIEGDDCNLVTINFSAEFDESDIELLEWILDGQDIELDGDLILGLVDVDFSATFCVPDGCYEFSMVAIDGVFDLLGIEIEVIYNDEVIALEEWIEGDTINFQFGVNDDCETSVGELEGISVNVYPNPARDILNISFDSILTNVNLDLYDISGKWVRSETVNGNSAEIGLHDLAAGLYTLRISNNDIIQVSKIEIAK